MKMYNKLFLCTLLLICLASCKKEKAEEWFVITENESMCDSLSSLSGDGFQKGGILLNHGQAYRNRYYELQFILDANDSVYIYQNEIIYKRQIYSCTDEEIGSLYSNYIGLRPEHFITFDSKYFVDFLKANNDIFGFNINDRDSSFIAVIASTTDTIKNPVLYQLRDLIKGNGQKFFLIRKTTEEENAVLYHKRRDIPYHPEKWHWSTHFLDGKHRPFTPSYDSLERNTAVIYKAVPSIKRQIKRVRHIR